MIPST